jgi:hypothetical protein
MKAADVKDVIQRKPFRPVRIEVTNGNSYEIEDGDRVACNVTGTMVFVFAPDGRAIRIDADQIAALHGRSHQERG